MPLNITQEVKCPSGLTGRIRGMKVRDEELLLDPRLMKTGDTLTHLLDACWEETIDPGPYSISGKLNWNRVSSADRTHTLIQIRVATYGDEYSFGVTCEKCNHSFQWGVSLNALEVSQVSEIGRKNLAAGDPIPVTLSTGDVIQTKVCTGMDEKFIANMKVKDKKKILTFTLSRRIVEICGKTKWADVLAEVSDLPKRYADELWDLTDEIEGGVDTTFMVECPDCNRETEVTLPFNQGFFSNRKRFADSETKSNG